MVSNLDYTSPSTQYTFNVNTSPFFKKNNQNYINVVGVAQLNTLRNISLLDIFLSTNNVVEPHYHQNAAELVYCISGEVLVSIMNPFTKLINNYLITPGQVANIPQGWWHYEMATVDHTHLLAIFDAPTPEVILGSDILRLTPPNVMAHTYGLNVNQWQKAVEPIKTSTYIGPPIMSNRELASTSHQYPKYNQPYQNPYQPQQYWCR